MAKSIKVSNGEQYEVGVSLLLGQDSFNLGKKLGTNVELLFSTFPDDKMDWLAVVNTKTGESIQLEFADTVEESRETFVVLEWHWNGDSWLDHTYIDCFLDLEAAVQCTNEKAGIMVQNNADCLDPDYKLKELEFSGKVFMPGENIPTSRDGHNHILGFYQIIRKEF